MNFKGLTHTLALVMGMIVAVPYLMLLAVE